jgi:hypothetical protein
MAQTDLGFAALLTNISALEWNRGAAIHLSIKWSCRTLEFCNRLRSIGPGYSEELRFSSGASWSGLDSSG